MDMVTRAARVVVMLDGVLVAFVLYVIAGAPLGGVGALCALCASARIAARLGVTR